MAIFDSSNETHDKYIQALKAMEETHTPPEYHKVPDTREEVEFMKQSNKRIHTRGFMFHMAQERYNQIFRRNSV